MPAGLGSWLAFAEQHGKKLAVPEWGTVTDQGGGGDDSFYVNAMYDFFAENAPHIAFEAYFDTGNGHAITGATEVPKAAATYQRLWGATTPPAPSEGTSPGGTGGTGGSGGSGGTSGSGTGGHAGGNSSVGSKGTGNPKASNPWSLRRLPAWTAWRVHRSQRAAVAAMHHDRLHRR